MKQKSSLKLLSLLIVPTYFLWVISLENKESELDIIENLLKSDQKTLQYLSEDANREKFYYMSQFAVSPVIIDCEFPSDSATMVKMRIDNHQKTIELINN